jgi:hypothetical protein
MSFEVEKTTDVTASPSQTLAEKTMSRLEQESKNDLSDAEITTFDTFLSFLDFGDLHAVVSANPDAFSTNVATKLPKLLVELSFYRRRIAHNRPITEQHITAILERWQTLQKILIKD